jgi:hypothetical protein
MVQIALENLFGYHLAPEAVPKADDTGFSMDASYTRYVVRLAGLCAGGAREPSYLHAHAVDIARSDKRTAARRGLLMAVLGILICSDQQSLDESALFAALSVDPRLARALGEKAGEKEAKADKGEEGRGFSAALDDFADQDEAAELLARWPHIISKDFVAARLLVREKVTENADPTTGAMKETFVYGIGPAARATVGAFAPLEIARVLGGQSTVQAGVHMRTKTSQLMPKEVGTAIEKFTPQSLVAFFNHLPHDTFGKDEIAAAVERAKNVGGGAGAGAGAAGGAGGGAGAGDDFE